MCPSTEHQHFCQELQTCLTQFQTLYQQLLPLQDRVGGRYDLRQTLQGVAENTARNIQYLSWILAHECSKCKNL